MRYTVLYLEKRERMRREEQRVGKKREGERGRERQRPNITFKMKNSNIIISGLLIFTHGSTLF